MAQLVRLFGRRLYIDINDEKRHDWSVKFWAPTQAISNKGCAEAMRGSLNPMPAESAERHAARAVVYTEAWDCDLILVHGTSAQRMCFSRGMKEADNALSEYVTTKVTEARRTIMAYP